MFMAAGCSSAMKARQAEREKVSATSGFFCEFINGEDYVDVDVQMNLSMAKKCDGSKPFSISDYKSSSDIQGMVYCCNMIRDERPAPVVSKAPAPVEPAPKVEAPVAPPAPPAVAKPAAKPAAKAAAPKAAAPAAKPAAKEEGKADVLGD